MKKIFNQKGYMMVLLCAALPIFLAIAGFVIDCGTMMYYKARLTSAVKFAAVSATSNYELQNDGGAESQPQLCLKNDRDFAERVLAQNFQEAVLTEFTIDSEEANVCKVEAAVEVPLYFTGILKRLIPFEESSFSEFADGTVKITISEAYLARRDFI